MKVWILLIIDCDDYKILGVYSSQVLAEQNHLAARMKYHDATIYLEEWTVT